jgi:hypothetical protein
VKLSFRLRAIEFEFDEFSDAGAFNGRQAVVVDGVADRHSLRVEHALLWQHDDLGFHFGSQTMGEAEGFKREVADADRRASQEHAERAGGGSETSSNCRVTIAARFVYRHTMISILRRLAGGLALFFLCASAVGETLPLTPADIADAAVTDEISIPMPGEFMAALGKLGKLDWTTKFRPPVSTNFSSRAQLALNLGGLIADGYVAIEAEDAPQVKNIGKDVLAIAKILGVSKDVLDRANSIANFADTAHWDQLKEELEATQNEVKAAMIEHKDQDLVTLVTVGGWLRAMEVISGQVATHYSPPGAKLLRQPGIVVFLDKRLDGLGEKMREEPSVRAVRKKMADIDKIIAFPLTSAPSAEDVKTLNALTAEVVKEISKKPTK